MHCLRNKRFYCIMKAKGGHPYAKRKHKSDKKIKRADAGGACNKIKCSQTNNFKMGTGSFT